MVSEDLKARILDLLKKEGPMSTTTLAAKLNARRFDLRLALAELVREGAVEKVPDYDVRRMVFKVSDSEKGGH